MCTPSAPPPPPPASPPPPPPAPTATQLQSRRDAGDQRRPSARGTNALRIPTSQINTP